MKNKTNKQKTFSQEPKGLNSHQSPWFQWVVLLWALKAGRLPLLGFCPLPSPLPL